MRKLSQFILVICLSLIIIGCSQKGRIENSTPPENQSTQPDLKPGGETVDLSNHPALQNRKIIYTVTLGLVSTDPSSTYKDIIDNLKNYDAFIESEEISTKSYRIKIRVKSNHLTEMVNAIQANGKTVNYVKTSQDITNSYSTLEARHNALIAQHARILELIEAAKDLSDILKLEAQRVEVEAELNEIGLSLSNYDSLIEYSTINLSISKIENINELLPQTPRPNVSIEQSKTNSVEILINNPNNLSTSLKISISQNGNVIIEITKDLLQYSKETILIDELKPGQQYKMEVTSQATNYSPSTLMMDLETEKTFFSTIQDVFIASLNALLTLFKFIAYAITGLLPFSIVLIIIYIPLRIYYVKKIKNKNRP